MIVGIIFIEFIEICSKIHEMVLYLFQTFQK